MELSKEQYRVCEGILKKVIGQLTKPILLEGPAGTGKTTVIIKLVIRLLESGLRNIAVVTFTGKASDVLLNKFRAAGVTPTHIGTIHSLFYRPDGKDEEGEITFRRKSTLEVAKEALWDVIIVDEMSMVDGKMLKDLQAFGIPLIFAGDNNQLAPVNSETATLLKVPTFQLTEVHRQAADNPIIKVSTLIRENKQVPQGVMDTDFIRVPNNPTQTVPLVNAFIDKYFVKRKGTGAILCADNATRHRFNARVRKSLGHAAARYPVKGEIVVSLRNVKDSGLKNGTLCEINETCSPKAGRHNDTLSVTNLHSGMTREVYANLKSFKGTVDWNLAESNPNLHFFDYGYALTVHKAQGSEWDAVLLMNRRMSMQSPEDYKRWLYTAVTRASKKLIMVG